MTQEARITHHGGESLEEVEVINKETSTPTQLPSYRPYKTSTLETPLLHFLTAGGSGFPTQFYALRWMLTYPLHRRMPGLLSEWTVGEVLFVFPWVLFMAISVNLSFVNPSVESSGQVAGYPLILMYLTATRTNSVFSFALGIPFERMLFYHKLSAIVAGLTGLFHLYVSYNEEDSDDRRLLEQEEIGVHRHLSGASADEGSRYAAFGPEPDLQKFLFTGDTNKSGTMIMLYYLAIFITSYVLVRRIAFEVFYMFHIIFAILSLYVAIHHGVNLVAVFIFWGVDIAVRMFLMILSGSSKQKAAMRSLPGGITELSFPKTFEYNPGQYIFICVPKLSILQWHPFSISSSPHQDDITIHFKALGGWTKALEAKAKGQDEISILIEGPYGATAVDLDSDRYKLAIFASGGIGVTPNYSLCNELLYRKSLGRDIQKIAFIWSSRKSEENGVSCDTEAGSAIALPVAFTPNLFANTTKGEIVRSDPMTDYSQTGSLFIECYMTGTEKGVQSSLPGVTYSRPKFSKVLSRMEATASAMGEKRVAVCICGPQSMVDVVRDTAVKHSKNGVYFDVHSELFEF